MDRTPLAVVTGACNVPVAPDPPTPLPRGSLSSALLSASPARDDDTHSKAKGRHMQPPSTALPFRAPHMEGAELSYLRAKVIALEGRCAELVRDNEHMRTRDRSLRPGRPARVAKTSAVADASVQVCETHPTFGHLLVDFGWKRVYRSSSRALVATVPIWCRQRPVEQARVEEIRAAMAANGARCQGTISVFEVTRSTGPRLDVPQSMGVFDGQHRLSAIAGLLRPRPPTQSVHGDGDGGSAARLRLRSVVAEDGDADSALLDDVEVVVEVYPVESESEVKTLFLQLNKAEIVKEIDLPDTIAPTKKKVIDEAVDTLRGRYPGMFKPSERCRPPHVHRDTLRNKLFHRGEQVPPGRAPRPPLSHNPSRCQTLKATWWPRPRRSSAPSRPSTPPSLAGPTAPGHLPCTSTSPRPGATASSSA